MRAEDIKIPEDEAAAAKEFDRWTILDWKECSEEALKTFDELVKPLGMEVIVGETGDDQYWFRLERLANPTLVHTHQCVDIAVNNARLLGTFDTDFLPQSHAGDGCGCHAEYGFSKEDTEKYTIVKR